jgi:tetratricopeptide (TPR) repeat protein
VGLCADPAPPSRPSLVARPWRYRVAHAVRRPGCRAGPPAQPAAYAALARGDSAGALARLEAIPDSLCLVGECFHLHLTLARLLAARGDDRRAAALLDRWRWAGAGPWFVLATLERGRVAERLGEREKAIESYRFVTEAWRRPDPELQPFVAEARQALGRLTAEPRR